MKANHISPENVMRYHYRPIDIPLPPPPYEKNSHKQEKALEVSSHEILCSEVNERQCSIEFKPSVSLQYYCATNAVISLSESSLIGNVSKLIQYRTMPCRRLSGVSRRCAAPPIADCHSNIGEQRADSHNHTPLSHHTRSHLYLQSVLDKRLCRI